jgi:hypothetical protein
MAWRQHIPGCFGARDLIFGGHPNERATARQMLDEASNENAMLKDLFDEAEKYLASKNALPQHISDQLDRMKQIGYWLS